MKKPKEEWIHIRIDTYKDSAYYHGFFMKFMKGLLEGNIIEDRLFYFFHENWDFKHFRKFKKTFMKMNKIKKMKDKSNYFALGIEIKNDEEHLKKVIKGYLNYVLKEEKKQKTVKKLTFTKFYGEKENYGKYWKHVKYLFWSCSLISIYLYFNRDKPSRNTKDFHIGKFVHTF